MNIRSRRLHVFCQKIAKKNLILPLLVLGVSVLCAASPQAREIKLVKGGIAQVLYVVDGDTVKLKTPIGKGNLISDQIRLVGIQARKF